MFYVSFVFDDSSRLSWLVEAPNERGAVNAILNKTKTVKKPKFVVVEKPCITSSDEDIDLLNKFESWGGEYENVFHIENKLAEIVCNSDVYNGIRYLTRNEREKLQGVPLNYTKSVSENEAAGLLGDGWTVDVVVEFFKGLKGDSK